jgi:hypothetical protein
MSNEVGPARLRRESQATLDSIGALIGDSSRAL